jgi:hypothetical protein
MTRKQFANLRMYKAVDVVLTTFAAVVATVPALAAFQSELQANIAALLSNAEIQDTASEGVAVDKEQKRLSLCRAAATMAGIVKAWAESTGNVLIAEQMDITYSDLLRLKDGILAERCTTIHDTANDHLAALANFNVTAAKLTALTTTIDSFKNANPAPRTAEIEISAATKAVRLADSDTKKLLEKMIDKLMEDFRDTNVDFYNQYKAARVIQDAPTFVTKLTGTVTVAGAPLNGVAITVIGKPYNTISKPDGTYELRITVPDLYTIKFSKSGYADKEISNVEIKLGEETKLDVEMVAV